MMMQWKRCRACCEVLTLPEFREGAQICRACEAVAGFAFLRRLAALDARRMESGLHPWAMRFKREGGMHA